MSRCTRGWMTLALCLLVGASPVTQAAAPVVAVRLVMTDVQGTPVMKKDLQGHILARYDYRPYGAQQGGPVQAGPGYTGHVNDPQTGLVYMQQRYYDQAVGRFLSVDPVGPSPGSLFSFNRFAYVNNNPVVNIDPDGTTCARADTSKSYVCQVDENNGKFTHEQIRETNRAYTHTVNRLSSHPNATVKITVNGVSFIARAGDVAHGLINAKVVTAPVSSTSRAETRGGGLFATSDYYLNYTPEIKIFKNSVTSDRNQGKSHTLTDLERTFAHEGIHTLPRERVMFDVYKANAHHWGIIHSDAYNEAGNQLLDGGQ